MVPSGNLYGLLTAALLILNTIMVWWSGRATRGTVKDEGSATRDDVKEVHTLVNSGLTKLIQSKDETIASTERAASAEGKAEGIAQERERHEASSMTAALRVIDEPVQPAKSGDSITLEAPVKIEVTEKK